ncbi:hypothetical protein OAK05_01145 [Gammaproteobacteria bacterium]|nr:hypothetical protein [Gammaproteobacteria bacterium]
MDNRFAIGAILAAGLFRIAMPSEDVPMADLSRLVQCASVSTNASPE